MDMLCRGAWRPVLADAEVVTSAKGSRARITVGGASTNVIDVVAHSTVQVRPKQIDQQPAVPGQDRRL